MKPDPPTNRLDLSLRRDNLQALWVLLVLAGASLAVHAAGRTWFATTPPASEDLVLQATEKIDPNTASPASLMRLPDIGPALAESIVQARKIAPIRSLADLQRIPHIGPVTAANLRKHLLLPASDPAE
jgi:DNA uptake protein ComE-like DNA-binding protein